MDPLFRYALCVEGRYKLFNPNAVFEPNIDAFRQVVGEVAELGYGGVEIVAPIIGNDVGADQYRRAMERANVQCVGLHWLLTQQPGVHLTDPDRDSMERTVACIVRLAKLTYSLGGRVMVHGSPVQRNIPNHDVSARVAFETAVTIYKRVMDQIGNLPVFIAMEQLGPAETDMFTTMATVVEMIEAVNHPHFKAVLDVKAIASKAPTAEGVAAVIRKFAPHAVHFHANDPSLGGPGFGDDPMSFDPIFQALADVGWHRLKPGFDRIPWVSVEAFNFKTVDLATIGRDSLAFMRAAESRVVLF